jgi:CheY-like chemotaxis protein
VGRTELLTDTLKGVHVLIVDDDRDSLEILRTIIRYFGALTTEARSAAAALAVLGRVTPDVVVIDLVMPGRSGLALIRDIRARPSAAGLHTVALTGHPDLHTRAAATAAGFDAYLRKPVDPMALCRLLKDMGGLEGPPNPR